LKKVNLLNIINI